MADDVAVTAGSGTAIATDDCGGRHVQLVKQAISTADSATLVPADATKGMYVDPRTSATVLKVASAGLTTSATAYVVGDVLGTELTFTGAARVSGGTGLVVSALLTDAAKIIGAVELFVFDSASTPAADNAANSWSDANLLKLVGVIGFQTGVDSALNRYAQAVSGLPLVVQPSGSADLKGVLVTRTAHTFFGAVGDLQVSLGIRQD